MAQKRNTAFTAALEDYLETIFILLQEQDVARVRDIARLRRVRPASVSPALHRLADLGLIDWVQGSYIRLTEEGERRARGIVTRHRVLTRFLTDVLSMDDETAVADACALEHSLSDQALERFVRLFEFLCVCPQSRADFLERFHACPVINGRDEECTGDCSVESPHADVASPEHSLLDLKPGGIARVLRVDAEGEDRIRLLNCGLIPDTPLSLEPHQPTGNLLRILVDGIPLDLALDDARMVILQISAPA